MEAEQLSSVLSHKRELIMIDYCSSDAKMK